MPNPAVLLALLLSSSLPSCLGVYDFGPLIRQQGHQAYGFPKWYRDDSGRKCQPCLHYEPSPATTISPCLSTVAAPLQPGEAPDEFFYYSLSAQLTDPNTGRPRVLWETGVEGAYAAGPVIDGDQMVFQRSRVLIHCPDTTPDTSKGQSYKFYVRTPYDRPADNYYVFPQPLESTVGGRRCIFHTIDVGATAQEFAANLPGPVDSYAVMNDPPISQTYTPGPDQPPQTYKQYGNYPAGSTVQLPGKSLVELQVWSNAWRSNPFDGFPVDMTTLSADYMHNAVLISSCEAYEGAALRAESATLITTGGVNYVDITATCDPKTLVTVTASSGWSGILTEDTGPKFAPAVSFTNNKPTLYSARLTLPSAPNGELQLNLLANGIVEDTVVAVPRLSGTAIYTASTKVIDVVATATSATKYGITVGTFNVRGQFTRVGVASAPGSITNSIQITGVTAVPERFWACQVQPESMKTCVPIAVSGNAPPPPAPPPSTPPPPPPSTQTLGVTATATPAMFYLGVDKQISLQAQLSSTSSACTYSWTSNPSTLTINGANTATASIVPTTADKGSFTVNVNVECWSTGVSFHGSGSVQVQVADPNLQVNWLWDPTIQDPNNIYLGVPFFINPTYTYASGTPLPGNTAISSFTFKLAGFSDTCVPVAAAPTASTAVKCTGNWQMTSGSSTLSGSVQLAPGVGSNTKTDSITVKEDTVVVTTARLTLPSKSKTKQYEFRVDATSNAAVALGARVTCQAYYYDASNILQFTLSSCVCDTIGCSALPVYSTWPMARPPLATDKVVVVTSALRKPANLAFAPSAPVRLIQ